MAFWSGETLTTRLSELIDRPDPDCVDCAAYTLKVGPEYYVTPNDRTVDPHSTTLQLLSEGQAFSIPAGQLGYILSEEIVTVPTNAIGFISVRARVKWKGLINVSGFHVDPGFKGRLLFAVHNSGPVSIPLRRGDPIFLIWFADLDADAPQFSKVRKPPVTQIDTSSIAQVAGEIYSVQGLSDKIRATEKELAARITALERANGVISVLAGIIISVAVLLGGNWIVRQVIDRSTDETNASTPQQQSQASVKAPNGKAVGNSH